MFQFPGSSRRRLCVRRPVRGLSPARVPPFGDLRVEGCLRLTAAYRSLPRPSSSSSAKASTVCPRHLHRRRPLRGPPARRRLRSFQSVSAYRPGSPRASSSHDRREYSTSRLISCLLFAFPLCACQGAPVRASRVPRGRGALKTGCRPPPSVSGRGASGPRASPRSKGGGEPGRGRPCGEAKPRAPQSVRAPE